MGRFDFVEDDFNGFEERDPTEHTHEFNDGKCVYCGKTREELRKKW